PVRVGAALAELWALIRSLRHRRSLAAWLASSMFSRDALNALYGFGGVYAGTVLGWPVFLAGVFGVISAVSAAIISWLGGRADRRFGPRAVIIASILALSAVCTLLIGMDRNSVFGIPAPDPILAGLRLPDLIFFACGAVIGGAGGALQAASRTMMVRHTTEERATEGFGLYALSGKVTAFLAPFLIAVTTDISGSQRIGFLPLIVIFLLALLLLRWVDPEGEAEGPRP
uniref:MFS transporter n=1 Tax=Paracoccus sp. TaxID=267 RepID=UPI00272B5581